MLLSLLRFSHSTFLTSMNRSSKMNAAAALFGPFCSRLRKIKGGSNSYDFVDDKTTNNQIMMIISPIVLIIIKVRYFY